MQNRILFLPVLIAGLTACIDLNDNDDKESEIAEFQSPVGEWVSNCIARSNIGLASYGDEQALGDYKLERIILLDGKYEKTIDYFEGDECVSFTGRVEYVGSYDVLNYKGSDLRTSKSSAAAVNEIKITPECVEGEEHNCYDAAVQYYNVGGWSVGGLYTTGASVIYIELVSTIPVMLAMRMMC